MVATVLSRAEPSPRHALYGPVTACFTASAVRRWVAAQVAGQVAVVVGWRTAVGDRLETGLFLRSDGGRDQLVAWRVDGEWRPGQGSEQRREHRRAA